MLSSDRSYLHSLDIEETRRKVELLLVDDTLHYASSLPRAIWKLDLQHADTYFFECFFLLFC